MLDKSLISDPSICNLLMRIAPSRMDAAVYSVIHDNSLILGSWPLGASGAPLLKDVEETVYDNPLLLSDFRRTYIILDTGNALAIPSETPLQAHRMLFEAAHPDFKGEVTTSAATGGAAGAQLLWGADGALTGFLRRTFHGASIDCHLSPLCRYFSVKPGRGNARRMVCNFRREAVDVVALEGNRLLLANTFSYPARMDAVYYILNCAETLGFDRNTDELLLSGNQEVREEIVPELRKFCARVMPVIFPPQMFRAGKEAMRAPFDMILTPLCE